MGKETKWGRRPWERSVLGLCVSLVASREQTGSGRVWNLSRPCSSTPPPEPTRSWSWSSAHPPADGRPSCPRSLSPTGEPGLPAAPEHRGRGGATAQVKGAALLLLRVALVVPVTASTRHWRKEEQLRSLEQLINKVSR